MFERALEIASRVKSLPVVGLVSPAADAPPSEEAQEGYLRCQRLAYHAVTEIGSLIREGWTEKRAAEMLSTYLLDHGVRGFFHHSFVWFGDRTRFNGVRNYAQYAPSNRVLVPGQVFILDVAPILRGFTCDVGYTRCLGENPDYERAQTFLGQLRQEIPALFTRGLTGAAIWGHLDREIVDAGYDNIHALYPFSVLGHRVHHRQIEQGELKLLNFGWQSYWAFLSRGLFGQLLSPRYVGRLEGLWAIEPHIGLPEFGAKFEELLVVDKAGARWLDAERPEAPQPPRDRDAKGRKS